MVGGWWHVVDNDGRMMYKFQPMIMYDDVWAMYDDE